MNNATTSSEAQTKTPVMQTASKPQLNTGYYDLLAQIALTHKRRNSRQA
ncbi:hypothetical protein [Bacterioplanoides sp. SCSIO 12839]|nr:hypothetical protein [Bacterioplanoides sp. SCSIO 12839]UTW49218.1 hypothetical protein KFF03_04755 [Bacterioplanoides sp. SCSIO 12839]